MTIQEKFTLLGVDGAPGQESRMIEKPVGYKGEILSGTPVDFSHGDVDAFVPPPEAFNAFSTAVEEGGKQAYTEYRGRHDIREELAVKLSIFTGKKINSDEIILTPGTQGALFLAMGACVAHGDKVAIVEPDYFANRKLTIFLNGELLPIPLDFLGATYRAGLNLELLEKSFQSGAKVFLFSNPNNPVGVIYSKEELQEIGLLARRYRVTVIADELYARQIFDGRTYHHLCAMPEAPEEMVTVIGPSKTESLSGYRLGVAFGTASIIDRMEKLQAMVSLRCSGYAQGVLRSWFNEPAGWIEERIKQHQDIRDDILDLLNGTEGVEARATEGGSYLFIRFRNMNLPMKDFIKTLRSVAGVTVTYGTEFGAGFTDWFRINFSQDHAAALAAVERILELKTKIINDGFGN
jgi:aspartate/methionine/tyrosine aminotransferase